MIPHYLKKKAPQHISSCSPPSRRRRPPSAASTCTDTRLPSLHMLLLLAATSLLLSPSTLLVNAASYGKQCSLLGSRVIDVTYSPATGEYYVNNNGDYIQDGFAEDESSGGGGGGNDRLLRGSSERREVETFVYSSEGDLLANLDDGSSVNIHELDLSTTTRNSANREAQTDGEYEQQELITLHARLCPCAPQENTYCLSQPHEVQNTCGIPRDPRLPVGCYNLTTRMVFIRNAWPVVVLWYGALLIFLVATDNGKSARNWVLSKICRNRNDRLADHILRREVHIRDRLRQVRGGRGRMLGVGDEEEGGLEGEPRIRTQTLVLKTKRFNAQREREKRRRRRRQQRLVSNVEEAEVNTTSDSFDHARDVADGSGVGDGSISGANPMTPERPKPAMPAESSTTDVNGTPDTTLDDSLQSPMSFPPDLPSPPSSDSFQENDAAPRSMSADDAMTLCAPCSPITPVKEETAADLSSGDDESDHEDFTCTICIMEVEDGDKVGALSCHHIFHVACLKEWIKRKNVCPLCQEPDIASPRPSSGDGENDNAAEGQSPAVSPGNDDGTRNSLTVGRRRGLPPNRPPQPRRSTVESIRTRLFSDSERGGRSFISRDSSGSFMLISPQGSQESTSTLQLQQSNSGGDGSRNLVLSGSADDAAFQR